MANVRWFLELVYIANIDADYLRQYYNQFLSGAICTSLINDFSLQRTWHRVQNNENNENI